MSERWLGAVTSIHSIVTSLAAGSPASASSLQQLNAVFSTLARYCTVLYYTVLYCTVLFSTLARLETEISLHTEAVLSGRLSEEHQKMQFLQQQQFLKGV